MLVWGKIRFPVFQSVQEIQIGDSMFNDVTGETEKAGFCQRRLKDY